MNSNIKGIKVGEEEIKNTLYADDTTLLLRDLDSVQTLLETLVNFRGCSGLELNKSKTEAMLGNKEGHTIRVSLARKFCLCFRYPLLQRQKQM